MTLTDLLPPSSRALYSFGATRKLTTNMSVLLLFLLNLPAFASGAVNSFLLSRERFCFAAAAPLTLAASLAATSL